MASTTRKWLVGCGLGCGGAIVLSIVAPLLFGLVMMRPDEPGGRRRRRC